MPSDSFQVGATTVSFDVQIEGRSRKASAEVSERHIPAGDTNYVDLGGKKSKRRSLSLLIADGATVLALENLCGQQGTLTYHEGTYTAVLEDTDATEWWPTEHQVVKASFLIVTSTATADTAPVAGYVYAVEGFTVQVDPNQGSTTVDDLVDTLNVEWGDGATQTYSSGPYNLATYGLPILTHTYASAAAYVVTISIQRSSVLSSDESQLITVTGE